MQRIAFLCLLAGCASETRPLMQHEITQPGALLGSDGRVREPGWARRQLLTWDGAPVADKSRLRQWDFFTFQSDSAAVNLTISDLSFVQLCTVGVVDFATQKKHETSVFKGSTLDQFALSTAVEGSARLQPNGAAAPALAFDTTSDTTTVTIDIPQSLLGEAARGTLTLKRRATMDYLSLATPFAEDPKLFFFEQKIPGMTADGTLTVGESTFTFTGATATMDWGRGAWPSEAVWRWAAAAGTVEGAPFAFNLGEGFGDPTSGTENLIIVGDRAHKLAIVDWMYDKNDPLAPWTFRARDGRLTLTMTPVGKETGGLELGTRYSRLKKGYGTFSGSVTLDDGRTVAVENLRGFAEEMSLKW